MALALFAGLSGLFASTLAFAADGAPEGGGPRSSPTDRVAVQRPKYQMAHELTLSFGVMPLDAFQKSLTGSLSYTLHLSRYFAWELFQVTAAHLTSTRLRDELIDTFAISPDDFNAPRFMATTGFELSPIYGKQVFLNGAVVHEGIFGGVFGGVIFGDRGAIADTLKDLRPAVGVGLGYRLFMSKAVSFRIDVRDFLSFRRAIKAREQADVENVLFLTGAISFNFWRDDA